jgi:hypothetical protein
MHDARVFANSELGQTLQERLAGTDYHLIGDLAYPLSERLLKSYRRAGANEVNRYVFIMEFYGDRQDELIH